MWYLKSMSRTEVKNPKSDYTRELRSFIGKRVIVEMLPQGNKSENTIYTGKLAAIAPEGEGFVILRDVLQKIDGNTKNKYHKIFLSSRLVGTIVIEETPFDLPGLSIELEKTFRRPGDVKLYEDSGLLVVLERVKVTEKGVEGSGPVADRVQAIYSRFVQEQEHPEEGEDQVETEEA